MARSKAWMICARSRASGRSAWKRCASRDQGHRAEAHGKDAQVHHGRTTGCGKKAGKRRRDQTLRSCKPLTSEGSRYKSIQCQIALGTVDQERGSKSSVELRQKRIKAKEPI